MAPRILEGVNVFNGTNMQVAGRSEVVGPVGDTALDASFDLAPADSEDEEGASATFDSFWG